MEEIKRAIVSIPFLVGLLVCTMAGLTGVIYDLPYGEGSGANYLFRCFHSLISILPLLAPVIATIPFANSYASERNSGFSKFIMQRLPVSSYKAAKLISNALAGGLVLAIPLTGAFLWFTIKYPIVPKPYTISGAFGELFTTNPIAYMWILIGLSFLFGATFATIGLAFSVLFSNQFFANILPLVVYIVPGFFFYHLRIGHLVPPVMWDIAVNRDTTPFSIAFQHAVLILVSVTIFMKYFRLKED